jgi:N-dimethylarginine dimethylaminohydrolase
MTQIDVNPQVEAPPLTRPSVLMCPPTFYGVRYVINPWMEHQIGKADHALATEQWENLCNRLQAEASIRCISPQPDIPDMVFTANAGLAIGGTVVLSWFRTAERRKEEPFFQEWFEQQGYAIAPWPEGVPFEGAGDALLDREQPLIWCGYGFRSSAEAPRLLEKIFERKTAPLRLVDPRFYHLDTCLCPLAGGWLLYYPQAFDEASQAAIAALVAPERRIEVGEQDALAFACNAVELNDRIFVNDASEALQSRLRAIGLEPTITPMSEFLKAGGGAKCLTLKLDEA